MITPGIPALEATELISLIEGNSMSRFRFLAVTGIFLASFAPLTANAQVTTPDPATQAALTTFRADAAELVTSLPDNKGVTSQQIAASYTDSGLSDLPFDQFNRIMVVRQWAEAASWDQLDPTQQSLIKTYWENTATAVASAH
jgi:hypothetical protein